MSEGTTITPHKFTDEEGRFMYGVLDDINYLVCSKCVDGFDTKNISAREILELLKPWADRM